MLDEATAFADAENEYKIKKTFDVLLKDGMKPAFSQEQGVTVKRVFLNRRKAALYFLMKFPKCL